VRAQNLMPVAWSAFASEREADLEAIVFMAFTCLVRNLRLAAYEFEAPATQMM
jgi:hypothetical protein